MSIAARVKGVGSVVLGLAIIAGMVAVGVALLIGMTAFSVWVFKWTFPAFLITLVVSVIVLGPLSLMPRTRGSSAVGFTLAASFFGAILWIWGMAYTYSVWGLVGVIIGLMLLGGGIVPIAMFAALVHADWGNLALFVVTAVIAIGGRILAYWIAQKADERTARLKRGEINATAHEIRE